MGDIVSIIDLIINNIQYLTWIIIILISLIILVILVAEHKEKVLYFVFHRRNKYQFALFLVIAIIIIIQYRFFEYSLLILMIEVILFIAYGCYCVIRTKDRTRYFNPILKRYDNLLKKGYVYENLDYFNRGHWYLFTSLLKVQYAVLQARYFVEANDYDKAYEALLKIPDNYLYDDEKEAKNKKKAMILAFMGAVNSSLQILGDVNNSTSKSPNVWMTYSYCFELKGDIDIAYSCAQKAKALLNIDNSISNFEKIQILNNIGRIYVLQNNVNEGIHLYKMACQLVKESNDTRLFHRVYSNLIMTTAINCEDRKECEDLLKEYSSAIKEPSIDNLNELNNIKLSLYRQFKDDKMVFNLIKEGCDQILSKLQDINKEIYKACTFRILMNGEFDYSWFDKELNADLEIFTQLPLEGKLFIFQEYMSFFLSERYWFLQKKEVYNKLYKIISDYYQNGALKEIESAITKLQSYSTIKYVNLMKHKLFILKFIEGEEHITNSEKIYIDVYNHLDKEGLKTEALIVLNMLLLECTSPINQNIIGPFGTLNYYEFMRKTYPVLEPILKEDGYHLQYNELLINTDIIKPVPLHIETIKKYIDCFCDAVLLQNHPIKVEMSIYATRILLGLGRKEKAREMFSVYKNSKLSKKHFSLFLQKEIQDIDQYFSVQ